LHPAFTIWSTGGEEAGLIWYLDVSIELIFTSVGAISIEPISIASELNHWPGKLELDRGSE